MADQDKYSTVAPMFGSLQNWIADEQERRRIAAYAVYEAIYWSSPDTFKLTARGVEDKPIYVPGGRTIVETMHRYVCKGMKFQTVMRDPLATTTNDNALALGQQVMDDLFARERLAARFSSNKRFGIMRGDWAFHLYADPLREEGSRLSVFAVDPASCFPIYEEGNPDSVIGWHIAEAFKDNDGKDFIRRLTYRKETMTAGPSPITSEIALFKVDDWGGPGMENQMPKPELVLQKLQVLPQPIDHLPIYMIPNFEEPGTIWGSSEMRGLERLLGALNQTISDEDLSLALDGLGVWVTDAGAPIDDDGNDVPWNIGPGRVVEVPGGKKFERVNSTGSVTPYTTHLETMQGFIDEALGFSDVVKGRTDVATAESGVALMLQMVPLLSRVEEKELTITGVLSNMLYDLSKWFVAYEGGAFSALMDIKWVPVFGDKLPRNRVAEIGELLQLAGASPQLLPTSYIRDRLRQLGYDDMPTEEEIVTEIADEQTLRASIQQDAFGARVDGEVSQELGSAPAQ